MLFSYTNIKKNSLPPPTSSSLWPPGWQILHGCITITGIAKGHKGPCPAPLDWSIHKKFLKGGVGVGYIIIISLHITYPLTMAFNVQENAVFIHKFAKNLPSYRGSSPPPLPLGRFAPSRWPPVDISWLHHCHWHPGGGGVLRFGSDGGVPLKPPNLYPSLRVILAEKGTHFYSRKLCFCVL